MQQPFICHTPRNSHTNVIYNSPHSGRIYNANFLTQTALSLKDIRASEDCYVDQLLTSVTHSGATLLEACFPRSFVDVNRAANDLDQKLIEKLNISSSDPRTAAGLGVVPRIVGEGLEIYQQKLSLQEVNSRLDTCYFPYHKQLQKLINQAIKNFGTAILFDFHSMPHNCLENKTSDKSSVPQIVIGDCFGSSCTPSFSEDVFDIFVSEGFSVIKNNPFSGGFITKHYGVSHQNIQAIQIEIDRSLYMDEQNLTLSDGYFALKNKLSDVVHALSNMKEKKRYSVHAAE